MMALQLISISLDTSLIIMKLLSFIGYIIIMMRFFKDKEYKLFYLMTGIIVLTILEIVLIFSFRISDQYTKSLYEGIVNSVLYSYIYGYFKKCSYDRLKEVGMFIDY